MLCHQRQRNFLVPPDLYNAALTGADLVERSASNVNVVDQRIGSLPSLTFKP
jgi:hypothetical protein